MQAYFNWLQNEKCLSKNTIFVYEKYLRTFEREGFNVEQTLASFSNIKNSTKRVILSSIKSYLKYIKDDRWCTIELPKKDTSLQDFVSFNEYIFIHDILSKKNNKNSCLKLCLIKLLYETGIRSAEVLGITVDDIRDNKILINGKGNKQRNVWMSISLERELRNYIALYGANNKLFNFGYKNLYKKIRGLGKHINKRLTPHMFRRGFATYCMKKNVDIYSLSQMMGHSDINTTKLYIYDFDLKSKMENLFQ